MSRVLLVEDEPGDAVLVRQMLDGAYDVAHYRRLTAGLAGADGAALVLLDLGLPESTGLDTLRGWRTGRPDLPVVVLTGADDDDLAARAVAEGAQDYVVKGRVDAPLLRRTIRYALERHHIARELERSRDELVTAIAERDEILAMASHDMSAPLTVLRASADVLVARWGDLPDTRRAGLVDAIGRASGQLEELVGDLHVFARERRGSVHVDRQAVRVDRLLSSAVEDLDPAPTLELHDAGDLEVVTDPSRLRRIVINLVQNAHKYGRVPVEVAVTRTDGGITLSVADHGDGVPADFVEDLFRPFARAVGTGQPGSGLGLAIVDRLTRLLGGHVQYRDRPGGGACFRVWLPLQPLVPHGTADVGTEAHR